MKKILFTAIILIAMSKTGATAQVTIGSTDNPQPFSILELEGGGTRGMRLPQMTTAQRKALSLESNAAASGLQIFNTTTRCIETWNGTKWIQACPPEGPYVPHYNPTCEEDPSCTAIIGFTATALSGDMDWTNNTGIEFNMKPVTGGVFYMGSSTVSSGNPNPSPDRNVDEGPVHKVALSSFYMSETEVTQKLFETVMGGKPSWTNTYGVSDTHPAYNVSWYDAIAFCNKLSLLAYRTPYYAVDGIDNWGTFAYSSIPTLTDTDWDNATCNLSANGFRLPTEAEWEYAARGGQKNEYTRTLGTSGTQYIYSGSNDICEVAWYVGNNNTNTDCEPANNINGTKQVKGKKANELGIYDMNGNVWEWCWDLMINTYDDCCVTNPMYSGSGTGSYRARRGGGWGSVTTYSCVSDRDYLNPNDKNTNYGIRVVAGAL